MALFQFTRAILEGTPIKVFGYGKHRRDFTYIDDIVEGIVRVLDNPARINPDWSGAEPDPASSMAPWRVYNIGNNQPVNLLDYISAIENALGKKAKKELRPVQPGDMPDTCADIDDLIINFDYRPRVGIDEGVNRFVAWYRDYYKI
jgi:UDP-glucuronate 4-epimerase